MKTKLKIIAGYESDICLISRQKMFPSVSAVKPTIVL